MKAMPDKKTLILHPFILAIYPILFYYNLNKHEVWFSETLVPMASSLFVALLLFLLLKLIFKSTTKSGILTSLVLILFFMYEAIQIGVVDSDSVKLVLDFDPNLFWTYGILLILATTGLFFWSGKYHKVTKYLNAVAVILIVFSLVGLVSHKISSPKSTLFTPTYLDHTAIPDNFNYVGPKPDIYYIIMDAYLREDVMNEFWKFNNSTFTNFLTKRGFYVAEKSRSNYSKTVFSLPSSLNMGYLPINLKVDTVQQLSNASLMEAIDKNRVVSFLKSIGYQYIHLSDDTEITRDRGQADVVITNRKYISSFSQYLLSKTILQNIGIGSLDAVHIKRNNILHGFERLEKIPKINKPTFTFAHFVMPHGPQAFDKNGNTPIPGTPESEKYFGEVLYANKKITQLVDHILANSEIPPIIMIQGDHGYLTPASKRPNAAQIKKGYSNLNAYYLPDSVKEQLYKTITPVNSFRLIFDYYFGTQLGLIEDKSYFSTAYTFERKFVSIPSENSLSNGASAWIKSLKQMILEKPNYAEAYTMLGAYYAKLKRFPEAMNAWEKALSIKPDLTWAHMYRAENFFRERNYRKAIKSIEKAIHLNSEIADAYTLLGKASLLLNDRKKSLLAFEKSAQISPNFLKLNDLGVAYFRFGKNKEAILHLKSAVKLNPYQSRVYFSLGSIYLKTKDYRQAIDYNQMAIEHNPDHLKAYINLGNAQFQLNELDQAKATFEKALLKNPALAGIHRNLGIVYSQKDRNPSKAISHFQEYLRLSPNQPDVAQIQSMIQALTIQR